MGIAVGDWRPFAAFYCSQDLSVTRVWQFFPLLLMTLPSLRIALPFPFFLIFFRYPLFLLSPLFLIFTFFFLMFPLFFSSLSVPMPSLSFFSFKFTSGDGRVFAASRRSFDPLRFLFFALCTPKTSAIFFHNRCRACLSVTLSLQMNISARTTQLFDFDCVLVFLLPFFLVPFVTRNRLSRDTPSLELLEFGVRSGSFFLSYRSHTG